MQLHLSPRPSQCFEKVMILLWQTFWRFVATDSIMKINRFNNILLHSTHLKKTKTSWLLKQSKLWPPCEIERKMAETLERSHILFSQHDGNAFTLALLKQLL